MSSSSVLGIDRLLTSPLLIAFNNTAEEMAQEDQEYRQTIINRLRERNKRDVLPFKEIILQSKSSNNGSGLSPAVAVEEQQQQ